MNRYCWKTIWTEIVSDVSLSGLPPIYGIVKCKKGATHYRNYKRPLKNGKGLTLADICAIQYEKEQKRMLDVFSVALFCDGGERIQTPIAFISGQLNY